MPKIVYKGWNPRAKSRALLHTVNEILIDYNRQGYDLTLRQLFYKLVTMGIIPNTLREYKNLGELIKNGRYAGMIDWNSIVDRTRNLRALSSWSNPGEIIFSDAECFHLDHWKNQDYYCETWVEKDALIGVIGQACEPLDIPYFSCRGYASASEIWRAAMRIRGHRHQNCVVLYLGDHDPSGIDMTRDIRDRFSVFEAGHCEVRRIALTMEQIEQYNPPPNPTKLSDARAEGYIAEYGDDSWELDALEPSVIEKLITDNAQEMIDTDVWDECEEQEQEDKDLLGKCAERWPEVVRFLADDNATKAEKEPGKPGKAKKKGKKKAKKKGK